MIFYIIWSDHNDPLLRDLWSFQSFDHILLIFSRIIPGSPAERCGRLHVGDRILAVNHVDINALHHGDIVNLIKDSGYSVVMTVGPPIGSSRCALGLSYEGRPERKSNKG